jgi:hypothetical protein
VSEGLTNKELLMEVRSDVKDLHATVKRLAVVSEEGAKDLSDHEGRIRLLERWRYTIPASVLTALAAIFTA